jgi:hypothetical protein
VFKTPNLTPLTLLEVAKIAGQGLHERFIKGSVLVGVLTVSDRWTTNVFFARRICKSHIIIPVSVRLIL